MTGLQFCGLREYMTTINKVCLLVPEALVPISFQDSENTFHKPNDFE